MPKIAAPGVAPHLGCHKCWLSAFVMGSCGRFLWVRSPQIKSCERCLPVRCEQDNSGSNAVKASTKISKSRAIVCSCTRSRDGQATSSAIEPLSLLQTSLQQTWSRHALSAQALISPLSHLLPRCSASAVDGAIFGLLAVSQTACKSKCTCTCMCICVHCIGLCCSLPPQ